MKHTNTASSLHRCRKALAAALGLLAATAASAQVGPPGELDPTFGSAGVQTTDFFSSTDAVRALAALPDGRVLAAGVSVGPNITGPGSTENASVARYLPNGQPDPTFATNGKFHLDIQAGTDSFYSVKRLPDGSVLLAGELSPGAYSDFGLVKLTPSGALDTTFGMSNGVGARTGYVRLDVAGPSAHDEGRMVAVQHDGKIIVAGNTLKPVGPTFSYRRVTVARFTADGQLDTTFGGAGTGYVVLPAMYAADAQNSDYVSGIAQLQSDQLPGNNTITISGYTAFRNNAFLIRLTRDGLLDTTFGAPAAGGGRTGSLIVTESTVSGQRRGLPEIRAARIDDFGRIVVVGSAADRGYAFLRFNADGTEDATFGTNGRTLVKISSASTEDLPFALALQGNGKIVAAGYAPNIVQGQTAHNDFFIVRLQSNGQPDPTFAGDAQGRKMVVVPGSKDEAAAIAVEPSGNIVVGGTAQRTGVSTTDYAITRLYGDPDRLFADDFDPPTF
ncbi:hypothetical protein [Tahibacter soli]|uniref:Delta-60 repeat protein n=1 Tax=Tahibacter soli TaxID=2983605 RepID=A0A9X4BM94_9GAMM|nr:hypothetical protein [Tahibacter soli]MDC8015059.1 hypothetical protein [Tahibacter soli]